ncbi:hypothetical protein CXB51_003647 [Gossypium anomalum]|uniref:Uncharacterized protein n=1 Tax=Gossypium anomalum TaxID=47600 RepID=A0A8J5ZFS7_9ROSI|nr:hypothetical protein CXB51_003647 [Gossypium anomalum]
MYPHVDNMSENPPTPTYSVAGHQDPIPASGIPGVQPHPMTIHHHMRHQPYIPHNLSRIPSAPIPGQWTSGLCHCFDDPVNSCVSRGFLFGMLAMVGAACFYSCFYRSKLRGQYDLPEEPCTDCLVHFCCAACALCQEYRELKNRGFDMGIGWEANMDRQKRGVTMAPIVVPGMAR